VVVVRLVALVLLLECDVGVELDVKVLELGTEDSVVCVGADGDVELRDAGARILPTMKNINFSKRKERKRHLPGSTALPPWRASARSAREDAVARGGVDSHGAVRK
jgi:hypothetical protein